MMIVSINDDESRDRDSCLRVKIPSDKSGVKFIIESPWDNPPTYVILPMHGIADVIDILSKYRGL